MSTSFSKHSISLIISLLLILALFVIAWLFPSIGTLLWMIFLLFAFAGACFLIVKKHRGAYLEGRISRIIFMRSVLLEITGVLLAMVLAGLLGRYLAEIGTRRIDHELGRIALGVLIGLLAGTGVGLAMQRIMGRFVKNLS